MKSIAGKRLCKILEENGWQLKTIRGSHHVYMKPGRKESSKDLKTGLLRAVLKIADIREEEL